MSEQIQKLHQQVSALTNQVNEMLARQQKTGPVVALSHVPLTPTQTQTTDQERRQVVWATLLDRYGGNVERAAKMFTKLEQQNAPAGTSTPQQPTDRRTVVFNTLLGRYGGDKAKATAMFHRLTASEDAQVVALSTLYKQSKAALTRADDDDPEAEAEARYAQLSKRDQETVTAMRGGGGHIKPLSAALAKFDRARRAVLKRGW